MGLLVRGLRQGSAKVCVLVVVGVGTSSSTSKPEEGGRNAAEWPLGASALRSPDEALPMAPNTPPPPDLLPLRSFLGAGDARPYTLWGERGGGGERGVG